MAAAVPVGALLRGQGWSLRSRLLAIAAVSGVLAWLAGGAAVYLAVQREDALLFDARLRDIAQTLLVFADHEIHEVEASGGHVASHIETEGTAEGRYRYQIWSQDGRLVLSSRSAPLNTPLMPLAQPGWATRVVGGEVLRVIALAGPSGRYLIQAAEPVDQRLELQDLLGPYLAAGVALSTLALAIATLVLLRMALRPLRMATTHLGERGPADLRAVNVARLPREFAPAFDAVNQLMRRVVVALRSEREFVSAAAHELRTPLAGLRAQAELAAHGRTSPSQRDAALLAVQEGVDQAAHLVAQLLDLARSDALAGDPARLSLDREAVDVMQVFERVLGDLGSAAAERGLSLRPHFEVARIDGADFAIGLILRNLVANAVEHAPAGSEIRVGTRSEGDRTVLWVADGGPGIPQAERERIFERFYRGKGSTTAGCGLGLSIVKALSEAHGAQARLGDAPGGGLLVEVSFPAA
jgi:two-component system OmpR family sensor kinase/two-component system sensor histidine kinase QseC